MFDDSHLFGSAPLVGAWAQIDASANGGTDTSGASKFWKAPTSLASAAHSDVSAPAWIKMPVPLESIPSTPKIIR